MTRPIPIARAGRAPMRPPDQAVLAEGRGAFIFGERRMMRVQPNQGVQRIGIRRLSCRYHAGPEATLRKSSDSSPRALGNGCVSMVIVGARSPVANAAAAAAKFARIRLCDAPGRRGHLSGRIDDPAYHPIHQADNDRHDDRQRDHCTRRCNALFAQHKSGDRWIYHPDHNPGKARWRSRIPIDQEHRRQQDDPAKIAPMQIRCRDNRIICLS